VVCVCNAALVVPHRTYAHMNRPQDYSTAHLYIIVAWCWIMIQINGAIVRLGSALQRWVARRLRKGKEHRHDL